MLEYKQCWLHTNPSYQAIATACGRCVALARPTECSINSSACLCRSAWASVQSLLCFSCRGKPANGDYRKDPRDRSRSPIERLGAPAMSLVGGHLYAHMPSLAMDQPLALTKNMDATRTVAISPTVSPVERQQVTTSVHSDFLFIYFFFSILKVQNSFLLVTFRSKFHQTPLKPCLATFNFQEKAQLW